MKQEKIIFVFPQMTSFIQLEIDILSKKYEVIRNTYNWKKKALLPIFLIHQFFYFLWVTHSSKHVVVSFGGYWAIIPTIIGRLFKKPVSIILHGTDCACIPELNYGSLCKPLLRYACKLSYNAASMLLPVSSSLIHTKNTFLANDESSFQGYLHFFPDNSTKCKVIHNGLDINFWQKGKTIQKEKFSFIAVFSNEQFLLKGGDLILEVAKKFPECTFRIAGCNKPEFIKNGNKNVTFLGKLSVMELKDYYCKSQFHFQLSIFEGFGLALCEAMLCECIPIGSSVNMIPEIIGNTGFIVEKKNNIILEKILAKAISAPNKEALGVLARTRIIDNYSLQKREDKLLELLEKN